MAGNFKHFLTFMLIIGVIASISPVLADVSMLDALGITPFSEDTVVNIDGIDFNIPKGYGEEVDLAKNGEIDTVNGVDFITFNRDYVNNNGESISISVFYDSSKSVNSISPHDGEVKKTIDGVDGVFSKDGDFSCFSYCLDGKTIMVSGKDENTIANVMI